MFQKPGSVSAVSIISLICAAAVATAEPRWQRYENVLTCSCEDNPMCLLAVNDGSDCKLLWAANRPEADRLRPEMNTIRREAACEAKNQSGFEIDGVCRDVSLADVMKHERMLQIQREKARSDCISRGASGYTDTATWLGLLNYECVFDDTDDGGMISCDPGQCYDSSATFGGQCRDAPGCPGGQAICGSPGC